MEWLLRLVTTLAIVSSAHPVLRTRTMLGKTTLLEAWLWGVVAICLWGLTWCVSDLFPIFPKGLADQLWLVSAGLILSPFVAALGSRRPGSRVWSFFVVLPVILVLMLPAVTAWNRDLRPTPLRLETPMVVGYALVLVMGAGNYLGTRFAVPALLVAGASLTVVWPLSELGERYPLAASSTLHAGATAAVSIAAWLGAHQAARTKRSRQNPLDTVWDDYRDFFGIVWGRRVMDRVNHTAQEEGWPVRLQFEGFVPVDAASSSELSPDQRDRVEQALRWLLRRFVDPEWIDERMAG
jgi:hypothetical protein